MMEPPHSRSSHSSRLSITCQGNWPVEASRPEMMRPCCDDGERDLSRCAACATVPCALPVALHLLHLPAAAAAATSAAATCCRIFYPSTFLAFLALLRSFVARFRLRDIALIFAIICSPLCDATSFSFLSPSSLVVLQFVINTVCSCFLLFGQLRQFAP